MAHRFKVAQEGPYPHFITATIVEWLPVFTSTLYFDIILDSLGYLRANRGLAIHAYVIMPTHFHAIVTATGNDLSAVVRDFKRFTARAIYEQAAMDGNRSLVQAFESAVTAPKSKIKVWQDEFHPEVIYARSFFDQKVYYTHANPIRKGLAEDISQWMYSSANAYAGGETGPLEIDWLEW